MERALMLAYLLLGIALLMPSSTLIFVLALTMLS